MNGFEQIKSFYSWVFNNPDKIRPTHISLYLFLLNQNNRSMWVEWFKCPYDLAMQGACIGNKNTYYRCLDDLQKYNLIEYKKGINNYKAPLIRLICLYDSVPLTEQVTVPQSEPQHVPQTEPLTEPLCGLLNKNIYKLITDNYETINSKQKIVSDFILSLDTLKNKKEIPIFEDFRKHALEQKPNIDEFHLKAKYDSWVENGWKDGNGKQIKNWKSKINNTIPYLKENNNQPKKEKQNAGELIKQKYGL